jgi:alpha-glucosidase
MWWQEAVIYQIYPRSFQDSDGDGIGDLRGIERRLDHLAWLGVDALWMSPIYPSPMHDFGYDVSDYKDVDPVFGSLEDFDRLVAGARERGLRVLLDLVPCHTSIEHPWFREHPDWYIWSDAPRGAGSTAATTCTRSTPSNPTSTGATPSWWPPCRMRWASGSSAAPPATASTRSTGC